MESENDSINNLDSLSTGSEPKPFSSEYERLLNANTTTSNPITTFNYQCPHCKGKFKTWDDARMDSKPRCPFCQTEKGEYPVEE